MIFENILFPSQYGFRTGYSALMTEKVYEAIDRGDKFGAILTDISKVFNCINYQVLIVKIGSYGVSPLSTKIVFSYLSNHTQGSKIKHSFSKRSNMLHGGSQWSFLGPLLFNIDLIDSSCECVESDIASYAEDKTP